MDAMAGETRIRKERLMAQMLMSGANTETIELNECARMQLESRSTIERAVVVEFCQRLRADRGSFYEGVETLQFPTPVCRVRYHTVPCKGRRQPMVEWWERKSTHVQRPGSVSRATNNDDPTEKRVQGWWDCHCRHNRIRDETTVEWERWSGFAVCDLPDAGI